MGCARQPPAPEPDQPAVQITPEPPPEGGAKPEAQPPTPVAVPPEPPPAFTFTPDLAGQALARTAAPSVPVKLAGEQFGTEPKPHATPAKYLDPDPIGPTRHALAPVRPTKLAPTRPAAPAEKPPLALGAGAGELPAAIVLPVVPVVTERARDVNIPPPPPMLGRQNTERVPFDDPTSEVGNAVVVSDPAPVPLGVSGFLKVAVPGPLEFGERVKPNVSPKAEPSPLPVEVNPQRGR